MTAKDIRKKFGLRVRALRKSKGFSQEKLGSICGLDRTYISGVELGHRNISLINIEILAKSLGVSIQEIFRGL